MREAVVALFLVAGAGMMVAQTTEPYKMAGPYEVIARDGQFAFTKGGSERDMWTAWRTALNGDTATSKRIIDAYASTFRRIDGHDAPLCAIQCYWMVRAMMLLRSYMTSEWTDMINKAMVPMMEKFEADSPYANGNWGAIVNRLRMACAICLQDSMLYKASVDYYLHAWDNGSLPRYICETGQCQETGRDQQHVQLGLGAMCDLCEMAWECQQPAGWNHGRRNDDLYGALGNRLMKGLEYTARYNLGYDVPFKTWTDCTGLYGDWTAPGTMGRGRIRDIYRTAYQHYVGRCGLSMPYTKQLLELQAKAVRKGEVRHNLEADEFIVKGVKEGERLHELFCYPAPGGAPLKHDYEVYVRPRNSEAWTKIDTYMAKVNAWDGSKTERHRVSEVSFALFDFTGDVFVRVITKGRTFASARIRPAYRGVIPHVQNDSTIQFMLFQPENISVEFDGDITNNLMLFTSKPVIAKSEAEKMAKAQGRDFRFYPKGLYSEKLIRVPSNTTVYLEGGSYFMGTFAIEDAENVSIIGRGIARPMDGYEGCHVHRSRNVCVDGLVVNTCPVGGCDGVVVHDVRSISHPGWGDGLNVFASENVVFDRVFCRNSDDCTTAYATRKGFEGNTRNITMRNSILWADVAHPIFIGIHGNAERGDTIEHLRYENIDILGQAEPQVDYQGCMAVNCGDNNLVRDVIFDHVRVEQISRGALLQVKVGYNQKYCTAPGRGVENVSFRNIRYQGNLPNSLSLISGYDAERCVRNVTFENLKINGRLLHDRMSGKPAWYATADYVPMFVGPHVGNVVFGKDSIAAMVGHALAYCSAQTDRALVLLRPYDFKMMPRNILQNNKTVQKLDSEDLASWNLREASLEEWCSGFWPGILWMDFAYNKSEAVKKAAEGYTEALLSVFGKPVFDHDIGFIAIGSVMKGYEMTNNPTYRMAALRAADSLATLFNPAVGTLLSWPRHVSDYGGHNTIIDNMMNLELLFWAARERKKEKGRSDSLYNMALSHAVTTMKNHFREDGSCFHVAVYDSITGKFIRGVTHQGYSDMSMWSRGQAWAIYGYTMVYRYTRERRFLDFAQKVADIYLKRLRQTSDDWVPYWDMDAPRPCAKDASAACVVASALLELDAYAPSKGYREAAVSMLCDLSSGHYQSRAQNVAFLCHSTGHHPAGSEVDASIIYADCYYLEALSRLWRQE